MSGVNLVIVLGRVGKDPEIRYTQSGSACANLSVATSEKWKDKQTGQPQEKTEWHKIAAFGKTAEIIGQYVKKGDQIHIQGKLQTRKWQDQQGQDRYTTEILANNVTLLGGGQQQAPNGQQYHQAPPQGQPQQQGFSNAGLPPHMHQPQDQFTRQQMAPQQQQNNPQHQYNQQQFSHPQDDINQ